MDKTSETADQAQVGMGHAHSPLFTMLPVELRLRIYASAFEGSQNQMDYWLEDIEYWPDRQPDSDHPPRYESDRITHCLLRPSQHNQLLFACRRIYEEALTAYWSHTVVDMSGRKFFYGPGVMLRNIPSHARP